MFSIPVPIELAAQLLLKLKFVVLDFAATFNKN